MSVLTRLVEYGETLADKLPTPAYAESVVHWKISLNADGSLHSDEPEFLEEKPQFDKKGKPKKSKPGQKLPVPHIRRNAVLAKLVTDTAEYVLGNGKKAEAYLALLERCAAETQDPAVQAVLTFVKQRPPFTQVISPAEVIMFQVLLDDGFEAVHDRPAVKKFWAKYVDELTGGEERPIMQCLATGDMAPVATKFALQVKGVPGTNTTGGSLVSAYDKTTSSYGLSGALVSPISTQADETLSQTLSYLLRSPEHHYRIGNIVYAFWADSDVNSPCFWENPNAADVRDYLHRMNRANTQIDPDWQFHILALTGNAGRIVVRDWVEVAEPEFAQRYENWLNAQSHDLLGFDRRWTDKSGKEHRDAYLNVWEMARAGVRESKEILPRTVNSIMRNVLFGEPLPIDLLQRICHRNRIERTVTYQRAVVLNVYRNYLIQENSVTNEDQIALQYGRLLATYAQLQCAAQKTDLTNTNAMKVYQMAGVSPLPMSHRLASGAKNHLLLLSGGLQHWYSQRLAQINSDIAALQSESQPIPQVFSTQAQAHFDLGFWSELNRKKEDAPAQSDQAQAVES